MKTKNKMKPDRFGTKIKSSWRAMMPFIVTSGRNIDEEHICFKAEYIYLHSFSDKFF